MSNEILPVYSSKGDLVGEADRKIIHHAGLWHPTYVCVVYDQKRDVVLFQVKSDNKFSESSNLEIDFSAGGHIGVNEDPKTTHRELEEELGLSLDNYQLYYLGLRQSVGEIALNYTENEWQYIWLAVTDNLTMDKYLANEESKGLIEFNPKQGISLLNNDIDSMQANIYASGKFKSIKITRENFVTSYITGEQIFKRLMLACKSYSLGHTEDLRW